LTLSYLASFSLFRYFDSSVAIKIDFVICLSRSDLLKGNKCLASGIKIKKAKNWPLFLTFDINAVIWLSGSFFIIGCWNEICLLKKIKITLWDTRSTMPYGSCANSNISKINFHGQTHWQTMNSLTCWICKNIGNMWRLKYFCKKNFRAKNNDIPFLVNTIEKEIALYAHVSGMKFLSYCNGN
jgi:hypothetical protein